MQVVITKQQIMLNYAERIFTVYKLTRLKKGTFL